MLRPVIVGAVALVGVVLGASTAVAEPVFNYDVTQGTSVIKKLNSSVPLGPGKLAVDLDGATGNFTSTIDLPPAAGNFKIFGIFPTTATVTLEQVGAVTGTLVDGVVAAHANINIHLSDVKAIGFIPLLVGDNCKSATPASIDLHSAPDFNPLDGGDLLATYTIPNFANCGLTTFLLNGLIPGPDNTITLTLKINFGE
jgi:hypothetical protein